MKLEKKHDRTARAFLQCRVARFCLNKVCKLNAGISVDALQLQVNALARTSSAKCEFSRAIRCRLPFDLVGIRNLIRAESPDVPCKCPRAAARDVAERSVASDWSAACSVSLAQVQRNMWISWRPTQHRRMYVSYILSLVPLLSRPVDTRGDTAVSTSQ